MSTKTAEKKSRLGVVAFEEKKYLADAKSAKDE